MHFTDIFIRRPVFATVLSLVVLMIGIISFMNMEVRQYPEIETSVIQIGVTYPGASAGLMEGFVTTPIENAVGSIDGIDYMTSTSSQSQSTITINLKLGYDINVAITDVGNKISSVRYQLPKDIQDPVISKNDPEAYPQVYIAFNSDAMSPEEVTDYLLRVVQPQLQTLDGVSEAKILGEREYAMRVNLNPKLMTAHNITASDVYGAIARNNLQATAGTVKAPSQQYNVVADTDMATPEQFNNMVLKEDNGHLIRIRDVGNTILGAKSYDSSAIISGKETTVVGIIPKSTANPLAVSDEVEAMLPTIKKELPAGLTAELTWDNSMFIKASIKEVFETIIEAIIFVIIVIFLFVGDFRAVFIPAVTIPLSIIGVCGYMYAMGYSINTLTLLAWVLAVGLVVDDAIVVLENIHRHLENGMKATPAAIKGAREIGFAVIAMTFTLAAVYAPIGFTTGLTGILFREFSFTLAGSVIVSGFIALTLSPMMCAKIMASGPPTGKFSQFVEHTFDKFMNAYKRTLSRVMDARTLVVIVALAIYAMCFYLFTIIPEELAPVEDQGVVLAYIEAPSAANIKYTEHFTKLLEPIYDSVPEMLNYGIINGFNGANTAISFLDLIPWDKRKRTAMQITAAIAPKMQANPGLNILPFPPPPLPGAGITPVSFVLKTTTDYNLLNNSMHELMAAARKSPIFQSMNTDIKLDKPQTNVDIDRDRAGDLGISMADIANTLKVMMAEPQDYLFDMRGRSYYIIPEFTKNFDYKNNPHNINNYYVRTKSQDLVPLSNIVKIKDTVQPQSLNHFQQLPSATLDATVNDKYTIGQALDFLRAEAEKILPSSVQVDYSGQSRQLMEASSAMEQAMIFAVIFIFLVLAAQFESYRDPLIVMSTVLLSVMGALLTLKLAGGTLNIYSKIGLITLVGLISKHGILIVEFANQLQKTDGMSVREAAIESASLRLRPILMTTAAMVLGAFPLAIATGAGAQSRHQIGWVIVGGMCFGTLFSLFVVPTVYTLIAKKHEPEEYNAAELEAAIAGEQVHKKPSDNPDEE